MSQPGCAPHRGGAPGRITSQTVGVYKARIEDDRGRTRRFRVLLFAALPDRVHGEVLSPLGRPQLILDGGDGMLAVTFVRDREAFVGSARGDVLSRILGVSLELDGLVRALLTGEADGGAYRIERTGDGVPALPETLAIRTADSTLALELKRFRRLRADPARLGTGRPPEGLRVRPIEDLQGEDERLERLAETVEEDP